MRLAMVRRQAAVEGSDSRRSDSAATCSPPTRTNRASCPSTSSPSPGSRTGRGSTQRRLARFGAERAQRVRAGQGATSGNQRYSLSLSGPLLEASTRRCRSPLTGRRRIRLEDDCRGAALRRSSRTRCASRVDDAEPDRARRARADERSRCCAFEAQHNHNVLGQPRRRRFRPGRARLPTDGRTSDVFRTSIVRIDSQVALQRIPFSVAIRKTPPSSPSSRGACRARAERLQHWRRADRRCAGHDRGRRSPTTSTSPSARHALRTGVLVERRPLPQRRAPQRRRHVHLREASTRSPPAQPTTFTRNVGNPLVTASQAQNGAVRSGRLPAAEVADAQRRRPPGSRSQHIGGLHFAPRGGFAWSPFKSGKTTIRGGGGVFFDWLDAQSYEQALQLDGTHQRIDTIVQPGYPNPTSGGLALILPLGTRAARAECSRSPCSIESNVAHRAPAAGRRAPQRDVRAAGADHTSCAA